MQALSGGRHRREYLTTTFARQAHDATDSGLLTKGFAKDDVMPLLEMVPPSSVRTAIRLEGERRGDARFKYDKVEGEKRIIVREVAERRDNLRWGAALQTALRTLYPQTHPLIHPPGNGHPDNAGRPR